MIAGFHYSLPLMGRRTQQIRPKNNSCIYSMWLASFGRERRLMANPVSKLGRSSPPRFHIWYRGRQAGRQAGRQSFVGIWTGLAQGRHKRGRKSCLVSFKAVAWNLAGAEKRKLKMWFAKHNDSMRCDFGVTRRALVLNHQTCYIDSRRKA